MELTDQLVEPRSRRGQATGAVLGTLAAGALLATTLVVPNAASAFAPIISRRGKVRPDQAERALRHAIKRGWVMMRDTDGGVEIALSKAGKIKWQRVALDEPLSSERWDQKWRLVVYDIPDRRKLAREAMRSSLKRLGLIQFQESVWITPHDCAKQVLVLRKLYEVEPFVKLIEASDLEGDKVLKVKFGLT